MDFSSNISQAGDWIAGVSKKPHFWEVALILGLILLIFAHKITIEGLIE
ncbi:MAG: hypothetical protein ACRD22_00565 [Terriglobia bacterium]